MFIAKDTKEPPWVDCCTSDVISQDNLANDEALCQVSSVIYVFDCIGCMCKRTPTLLISEATELDVSI